MTFAPLRLAALASVAATALAVPAFAQDNSSDALKLPSVTTTATKRVEDVQDVPVSVTSLNDDVLDEFAAGADSILFLSSRVPSLTLESSYGRIFPRAYIRGLGNTDFDFNASQPVSFIYDEVVYENPVLKGFPVFDLESVEVLRGPQGTLFGRNTPAGILKFDSAKPGDEFEAYVTASYATYETTRLEGAIGGPISDTLSVRASGLFQSRDDYIDNVILGSSGDAGGFDEYAYRLQALWEPTANFSWLGNVHGRDLDGGQVTFFGNAFRPGSNDPRPGFDPEVTFADAADDSFLDMSTFGFTSKADYDFNGMTFTYVFGYETAESLSRGDVDGAAAVFGLDETFGFPDLEEPADLDFSGMQNGITVPFEVFVQSETADGIPDLKQITHEFRLANSEDEVFDWTVGLYVFDEDLEVTSEAFDTLSDGFNFALAEQEQETESYAVFASGSYELTDQLTIAGGLRYTDDSKDFVAQGGVADFDPIRVSVGDEDLSWDVSATYAATEDVNYYGRIARGFRAPSVQGRVLFADPVTTADSETIISYEAGVKSFLADDRVRANVSAFYYEIDDQQLTAIGGGSNSNTLINADKGIGYGFEAELDFLVSENLSISTGLSYNKTEIDDSDLAVGPCGGGCTVTDPLNGDNNALIDGNSFPLAPEWIANIVIDYNRPFLDGEVFASTDWNYRSETNFFLYESEEFVVDPQFEGGVRVGYRQGPWEASVFSRNVTNEVNPIYAIDFSNLTGIFNTPRITGVELNWTFGE